MEKEKKQPMNRIARVGLIFVSLVLVLILVAAAAAVVTVRRPFPRTSGQVTAGGQCRADSGAFMSMAAGAADNCAPEALIGLRQPVDVYRDAYGIPHIYAQSLEDLFFAQGYVHAQDRFWQMEFWRHIGQGRVAEITGAAGVANDKFIRTVGWNRLAAHTIAYYEREAPEYITILEAYSAGVNAYIAERGPNLALQLTILGLVNEPWEIEPWTPLNTISWAVVMSNDLGGNWRNERDRAQLLQTLDPADLEILWPGYPYESRPVIAPTEAQVTALDAGGSQAGAKATAVDWRRVNTAIVGAIPDNGFALGDGPWIGSNNWVVSGAHTASGLPLLANDPHLGVQMPAIWYEVGLHAPGFNVVGFSFAGVPGVIVGHNDRIAWGVTNTAPDVQDLFIERINPDNPNQYEFMGAWRDMEIIEEVIKVNGGEDVVLQVRQTHHGPIISEVVDGLSDVLAFKWSAQEPSRVLQSVILLNQAQNFDDFRNALRYWDVPAQNFVYADVDGNIGYQMPGLVPIRKNGDGTRPVPGWTGEYEWEGWIPFEELPAVYNPAWGYIVTANHAVVDADYPYFITRDWADGDRGARITEMIEEVIASGKLTAVDFARIHVDSKSLPAQAYVPLLAGLSSDDAQVQAVLDRLRGWDFQERADSVPAALFEIFYMRLIQNVLSDDVGAENVDKIKSNIFMHALAMQPDAIWWDDRATAVVETREEMLLRSLRDAIDWFEANVGGGMDDWTWGSIHTITLADGVLGQSGVGPIEAIVNRGPFPVDGGSAIVNANGWRWDNPARVRSNPSMRMIVDMSDFDASLAVLPTGQSGHPYHRHYDDMLPLWLAGQYHPMLYSRTAVEAAAVDYLVLRPER